MSRKREPAAGARFSLCIAMSGRGHRGKRPRGDVTRGPRTSSYTGRLHVGPASLLCDAAFCDLQRHGFAILIIAAVWSILGCSAKAAAWSLLCWLSSLASWAAAFVLVMSFSPCISFIIPRLVLLVQIKILTLIVAVELFVQRCMGAPVPTPTPTPDPPFSPMPTPTPTPRLTPVPVQHALASSSTGEVCDNINKVSPAGMRGGGGQDECIGSGRCPWRLV